MQSNSVRSSESFNPQASYNPNSDAPGLKLSFQSFTLPTTDADAEQLLRMLFTHSEVRRLEKRVAATRLHEQIVYLDFLRRELNEATEEATRLREQIVYIELLERKLKEATENALEADKDLELARATIRDLGLSVPFVGEDSAEPYSATR